MRARGSGGMAQKSEALLGSVFSFVTLVFKDGRPLAAQSCPVCDWTLIMNILNKNSHWIPTMNDDVTMHWREI